MNNQKVKILDNFINRVTRTGKVSKGDILRLEDDVNAKVVTDSTSINFFTTVPSSLGHDLVIRRAIHYKNSCRKDALTVVDYFNLMKNKFGDVSEYHIARSPEERKKRYIGYEDAVNIDGVIKPLCDMTLEEFVNNYEIFMTVLGRNERYHSVENANYEKFFDFFLVTYEHHSNLKWYQNRTEEIDRLEELGNELFKVLVPQREEGYEDWRRYMPGKLSDTNAVTSNAPKYILDMTEEEYTTIKKMLTVENIFKLLDLFWLMMNQFLRSYGNSREFTIGSDWFYTDAKAYEYNVNDACDFLFAFLGMFKTMNIVPSSSRKDKDEDDDD